MPNQTSPYKGEGAVAEWSKALRKKVTCLPLNWVIFKIGPSILSPKFKSPTQKSPDIESSTEHSPKYL